MDRYFARLVNGLLSVCFLTTFPACELFEEKLPKEILISDDFFKEEEQLIMEAIEEWNVVGREYLGYDIIILKGRYADDGFVPMDNADDGNNVIYIIEKINKYYDYLVSLYLDETYKEAYEEYEDISNNGMIAGYNCGNDILVFDFNLKNYLSEKDGEQKYSNCFYRTVLHEFGHWVGLMHVPDTEDRPVMSAVGEPDDCRSDRPLLTEKDIDAFCLVHDCL